MHIDCAPGGEKTLLAEAETIVTARPPGASPPGDDRGATLLRTVLQPPDVRYQDRGEIGRGGVGTVRCAFDRVLLRAVAMKLIDAGTASDLGARFVEEAQITGQLDHPNIVPVYEFGTIRGGQSYFTMKLVSGRTLSQVIAQLHEGGFTDVDLEGVLRVLLKVCEAVAFAHSRGVIHRDLKPSNVMIGTHGQVYVMDWGLGLLLAGARLTAGVAAGAPDAAVRASVPQEHTYGPEGTVGYMAPEQALANIRGIDARTDVYALGAILYQVLTGRAPYHAENRDAAIR
jgi:serine/threonine-protein kinase